MENLRGRKDFLLPFFFFFPYPFYPREAKNPDEKKTSYTRRLSLQGTALHWRSPTLSYFDLSSPEENKWALMVYGLDFMYLIVNTL